jgi:hypothetical protein
MGTRCPRTRGHVDLRHRPEGRSRAPIACTQNATSEPSKPARYRRLGERYPERWGWSCGRSVVRGRGLGCCGRVGGVLVRWCRQVLIVWVRCWCAAWSRPRSWVEKRPKDSSISVSTWREKPGSISVTLPWSSVTVRCANPLLARLIDTSSPSACSARSRTGTRWSTRSAVAPKKVQVPGLAVDDLRRDQRCAVGESEALGGLE